MAMHHDENEVKLSITEPKEDERFYPSKVVKVIKELFEDRLKGMEYKAENGHDVCDQLVRDLKVKINREVKLPRYKLGVQVVLGEIKGQGLRIASKCLWDAANDNFASYTYTNEKMYCTAIVFGCYFD